MSASAPVAVVGGGWAGMAAAVELAARGVPVTVFEAGKVLGGRARRVEKHGLALDNGQHLLIGAYRETLRLISEVGASASLRRLRLDWRIAGRFELRAPLLPAPLHAAAALLGARGVPLSGRLAAARFVAAMRGCGFRLAKDATVAALLAEHAQSPALCRHLWYPLCIAALNTPPDAASAQVFVNVLRESLAGPRAASDMLLAATDLSAVFPDPAGAYVAARGGAIRLGTSVTAIEPRAQGFDVIADGGPTRFSQVVCAVSPHRAAALLEPLPELAGHRELIDRLNYQPIHTVYLAYPHLPQLPVPMLGLDGGIAQWIFDRERICGQKGLLGVVISAEGSHERLPQDELARRVHAEVAAAVGGLPDPLWNFTIAEKRATFACTPGLARPATATPLPGFHLAGDYTDGEFPATLEAAVRSGIACAAAARRIGIN